MDQSSSFGCYYRINNGYLKILLYTQRIGINQGRSLLGESRDAGSKHLLAGQHMEFLVPTDVFGERKQMPELIQTHLRAHGFCLVTESDG